MVVASFTVGSRRRAHSRPQEPTISIVIPALNEAANLAVILPQLPEVHETILVDGRSTDGTVEITRALRPDVHIIRQTRRGKGNALACGFARATGDIIVMFDADCSADAAEIPYFVDALIAGADFAKGSRFQAGGGSADITRLRSFGNRGLNILANRMLKAKFTDLCYGYNAFWADILDHLDLPDPAIGAMDDAPMLWGDGFEIETVINCRIAAAGLRVTEVASYEQLRVFGASNLSAVSDGLRVLKTIGTERRRADSIKTMRRHDAHARVARAIENQAHRKTA
jgi:glycosyltransferase involved in cell wall biosynthesis